MFSSAYQAAAIVLLIMYSSATHEVSCYRHYPKRDAEAAKSAAIPGMQSEASVRNACPQTEPWPCKSGQCLSFAFICDGRRDCADGFDEDKALCIAKDRPASIILEQFINRFHSWLVPDILGQGSARKLATLLTEERTLRDYAKKVGLTAEQREKLLRTMEFARDGRVLDLIVEGMPEEAYREAYVLFGRIVESGFLGYDAAKRG